MYNIIFLTRIEEFRRDLYGPSYFNRIDIIKNVSNNRSVPTNIKSLECYEDINGEWIPYNFKQS